MLTESQGAVLLAEHHAKLPSNQRYLRCVETHPLSRGSAFKLIICMTTRMSQQLIHAKRLSINMSFKRAKGWQEFEIESWDVNCQCCKYYNCVVFLTLICLPAVVGARAFTMSQTAQAHLILFWRIFDIAKADTGLDVHFRHIHGDGIESVIADSHKGQGLGMHRVYFVFDASLTDTNKVWECIVLNYPAGCLHNAYMTLIVP